MGKVARKWESLVTGKSKHLTRCGCNVRDAAANCQNDEDSGHDRGPCIRVRCNEEGLDEGHNIWVRENSVHISEAETERDQHYETKRAVNDNSPHHRARQRNGGISDLFRHLQELVLFAAYPMSWIDLRVSQHPGQ
jgi:hypothetical protein